ncbi:MAG: twin-arginine translocase TatA/TatE family subunit [Acidimicrobiales bacterium]
MLTADILGPDLIIVIVVGVIVLLFGGSKLPKLARGLGSASHEFKKGLEEGNADSQASSLPQSGGETKAPPAAAPEATEAIPKDTSTS